MINDSGSRIANIFDCDNFSMPPWFIRPRYHGHEAFTGVFLLDSFAHQSNVSDVTVRGSERMDDELSSPRGAKFAKRIKLAKLAKTSLQGGGPRARKQWRWRHHARLELISTVQDAYIQSCVGVSAADPSLRRVYAKWNTLSKSVRRQINLANKLILQMRDAKEQDIDARCRCSKFGMKQSDGEAEVSYETFRGGMPAGSSKTRRKREERILLGLKQLLEDADDEIQSEAEAHDEQDSESALMDALKELVAGGGRGLLTKLRMLVTRFSKAEAPQQKPRGRAPSRERAKSREKTPATAKGRAPSRGRTPSQDKVPKKTEFAETWADKVRKGTRPKKQVGSGC